MSTFERMNQTMGESHGARDFVGAGLPANELASSFARRRAPTEIRRRTSFVFVGAGLPANELASSFARRRAPTEIRRRTSFVFVGAGLPANELASSFARRRAPTRGQAV
jgi:vacuolar-type H+-ATPase subunit B/Vma2